MKYASKEMAERLMAEEGAADIVDDRMSHDGRLIEDWGGFDDDGTEWIWYTIQDENGNAAYLTIEQAAEHGLRVEFD